MTVDLFVWASILKGLQIGKFLDKTKEIKGLSMHIVGQENELDHVKEFFSLCGSDGLRDLKRLEMKADIEKFSPSDLDLLRFPQELEVLKFIFKVENMLEGEKTMGSFLAFGKQINLLKG